MLGFSFHLSKCAIQKVRIVTIPQVKSISIAFQQFPRVFTHCVKACNQCKSTENKINSLLYARVIYNLSFRFLVTRYCTINFSETFLCDSKFNHFKNWNLVEVPPRFYVASRITLTFLSTIYRQHGMAILSEMGVVVQKMVASECAGVLFTCHPSSGDCSRMLITSNYGLGEVGNTTTSFIYDFAGVTKKKLHHTCRFRAWFLRTWIRTPWSCRNPGKETWTLLRTASGRNEFR